VDFGASSHMAHSLNTFITYTLMNLVQYAYTIDGTRHVIHGIGDIKIMLLNGTEKMIPNVLHVSNLQCNLFSAKLLAQASGTFSILGQTATLYNSNNQLIASCRLENDLYILGHSISNNHTNNHTNNLNDHTNYQPQREQALSTTIDNQIIHWHRRLGHVNFSRLQDLVNHNLIDGIAY
jgi:hypothetical protein